jgi:lipopolysaccharide transport system permease protein
MQTVPPSDVNLIAAREYSQREIGGEQLGEGWRFNDAQSGTLLRRAARELHEVWRYRELLLELVRRDLKLRYKNSVGGVLWSLADPLMKILTITLMMKFIQAKPIASYSAYLFIIFLWNFISVAIADGCYAISLNAPLVKKVYFPRAILPLVSAIGNLFHFGIGFGFTIVYLFVLGTYPQQIGWKFLLVFPVILSAFALSLGIGFIVAYLNVLYEDMKFITNSLLQLSFFVLPVFFTIEQVNAFGYYNVYMLHPVHALIVTYQRALLPAPQVKFGETVLAPVGIPWAHFGLAIFTSFAILIAGFLMFEKHKWEVCERL